MGQIIIRKSKAGDEKGFQKLFGEGLKRKNFLYTGTDLKYYNYKKKNSIAKYDGISFAAIDQSKKKIVGSCGFDFKKLGRLRHRGNMGWIVHPDYQGRGIGTRLMKAVLAYAKKKGFKRAEAEMAVENKASVKLALKCGFKIEGRKKKALLTDDGRYIDTYVVGKIL